MEREELRTIWQRTASTGWRTVGTRPRARADSDAALLKAYGREKQVPGHEVRVLPKGQTPPGYEPPRPGQRRG